MGQTRFSLRNELVSSDAGSAYLELNPAVVSDQGRERFALSAVHIGPGREAGGPPLSMRVVCDATSATLHSVGEQSEPIDAEQTLTVALFQVSRPFLEMLAWADKVEIQLGPFTQSTTRTMAPRNRANVARFLDSLDAGHGSPRQMISAGAGT